MFLLVLALRPNRVRLWGAVRGPSDKERPRDSLLRLLSRARRRPRVGPHNAADPTFGHPEQRLQCIDRSGIKW